MKQNAKDNVSGRAGARTSANCIMSFSEGVKGESIAGWGFGSSRQHSQRKWALDQGRHMA